MKKNNYIMNSEDKRIINKITRRNLRKGNLRKRTKSLIISIYHYDELPESQSRLVTVK